MHFAMKKKGECDEALEKFAILKKLYPNDKQVLLGVARCHQEMRQFEKAESLFNKLVGIHPYFIIGQLGRLIFLYRS